MTSSFPTTLLWSCSVSASLRRSWVVGEQHAAGVHRLLHRWRARAAGRGGTGETPPLSSPSCMPWDADGRGDITRPARAACPAPGPSHQVEGGDGVDGVGNGAAPVLVPVQQLKRLLRLQAVRRAAAAAPHPGDHRARPGELFNTLRAARDQGRLQDAGSAACPPAASAPPWGRRRSRPGRAAQSASCGTARASHRAWREAQQGCSARATPSSVQQNEACGPADVAAARVEKDEPADHLRLLRARVQTPRAGLGRLRRTRTPHVSSGRQAAPAIPPVLPVRAPWRDKTSAIHHSRLPAAWPGLSGSAAPAAPTCARRAKARTQRDQAIHERRQAPTSSAFRNHHLLSEASMPSACTPEDVDAPPAPPPGAGEGMDRTAAAASGGAAAEDDAPAWRGCARPWPPSSGCLSVCCCCAAAAPPPASCAAGGGAPEREVRCICRAMAHDWRNLRQPTCVHAHCDGLQIAHASTA